MSRPFFIAAVVTLAFVCFSELALAQANTPVVNACKGDAQTLCPGVQPGGGRILQCLKQHQDQVSQGCKAALETAQQRRAQRQGGATQAPAQ